MDKGGRGRVGKGQVRGGRCGTDLARDGHGGSLGLLSEGDDSRDGRVSLEDSDGLLLL